MLVHNFVTQHQIFSVGAAEIFLGANQLSSETVGAALKTQRRTSGAAKAWIPHWGFCRTWKPSLVAHHASNEFKRRQPEEYTRRDRGRILTKTQLSL